MALLTTRQRNNFNRHNGGPARLGRLGDRLRLLDVDGTISGGFGQASFVADGDIAANDIITTSGYDGVTGFLKMKKADADTEVLTKNLYWSSAIVLSGATGTALKSGNFVSTLNGTIGAAVYLSTTAGRVTLEAPSGDNFVIEVGVLATTGATGRVDVELGGEKILIHDHSDDASGGSVSATPAVAGTTSAAFEVDTDGVVPALAIGSQAAGTGPFTQTLKPASTLTSGDADITIPDTAGAAGVVTLIGSTQTLTDKTLTDPTINAATITGAITITTPTVTGTWTNLGTVTTTDINGGSIDGVIIGAASAAAGSFTTISTTGAATVASLVCTAGAAVGGDLTAQILTLTDATNPDIVLPAGKTNTGKITINGKTSGSLIVTVADATAYDVTLTVAAQTVGAGEATIPDLDNGSETFVFGNLVQTLTQKTLDAPLITSGIDHGAVAGAASSVSQTVVRTNAITDNGATEILMFTCPNAAHGAVAKVTIMAMTDDQESVRCAVGTVVLSRIAGANLVGAVGTLVLEAIATGGTETLTLAYAMGSVSGAVGASNTMALEMTLNTSAATNGEVLVFVELLNAEATGITVAAA